jgi:hypothetical protein
MRALILTTLDFCKISAIYCDGHVKRQRVGTAIMFNYKPALKARCCEWKPDERDYRVVQFPEEADSERQDECPRLRECGQERIACASCVHGMFSKNIRSTRHSLWIHNFTASDRRCCVYATARAM